MKNLSRQKNSLIAWCLYDWANSAFPTVIITFVFATYFTQVVAKNEVSGMSAWGWMMSISAICIAIMAPIIGSIANTKGKKQTWLFAFTLISSLTCTLLWTVKGDESYIILALILVGITNLSFEIAMIFYNSILADLAPKSHIGRWSGWGWSMGYLGGLLCLAITLLCFVQPTPPLFGLDKNSFEHLRISGPLVGLWFFAFSLPLFYSLKAKTNTTTANPTFSSGLTTVTQTIKNLSSHPKIVRFLIARMIYIDGLNTLFAMGGVYAAGSFGFSFEEILLFGIAINITAGIGAGLFAWLDDYWGSKNTIMISIFALTILSTFLLIIQTKSSFWIFGTALGIFVGPVQSASRSLLVRITPKQYLTEIFGIYAFSGKITAFLGPGILALMTSTFDSQRAGMSSIIIFFCLGMVILKGIDKKT